MAALASAASLTACGNSHPSANGNGNGNESQPPIVSQTIPSEGGQAMGGAASPTTPASQAGEPGQYFKDENYNWMARRTSNHSPPDRYCGMVNAPTDWPSTPHTTGKWDIGVMTNDYTPGPEDCSAALSYFQDLFADPQAGTVKLTGDPVHNVAPTCDAITEGGAFWIGCAQKSHRPVEDYRAYPR